MKILYSHRTRAADGQWVHIKSLTQALRARGHEIFMSGPDGPHDRRLSAGEASGLKNMLPAFAYECAEYGYSFRAYRSLKVLMKTAKPDILYERYNLFFHAGVWLKTKFKLPLILEVNAPLAQERALHGNLSLKSFARMSEKAIWNAADKVLPVSNVLAEQVLAAGVPEDRIEVIHNGVEDDFLRRRDAGPLRSRYGLDGKLVLGFSGFVRDWHGVDRVVEFIAGAERPDLHLLIVGDGPARGGLETLAQKLGVAGRVTITGVVQREEMADHIAAFDVALQPAVVDYASPLKLFEYMAQSKPIFAPATQNIREVLTDDVDGLLFTSEQFESVLLKLVEDAQLRERLGAEARKTLTARDYTWAGNARLVEAIAEDLRESRS